MIFARFRHRWVDLRIQEVAGLQFCFYIRDEQVQLERGITDLKTMSTSSVRPWSQGEYVGR